MLKTSWGIVISIDAEELIEPTLQSSDIEVTNKIFLRSNDSITLDKNIVEKYFSAGIKDLSSKILDKMSGKTVCLNIISIEFSYVDFHEEALYPAI